MIGIDTNILVRYITQDDELQSNIATEFIENYCSTGNKIFVNHLVICELVWVLKKCYKLSKPKTITVIQHILQIAQFSIENAQIIWQALTDYKTGSADFADYVVGRTNIFNKCDETITFDKKTSKSKGFVLLPTKAD
ncbi:MAG: type II toxin-antitoxin system VapC family toxin [Desulfocapsa sp.]|nr:type II toxin-antitoxin system VapC family toxin [Desulfocapsa sp.]MBL4903983.1 type II toxin-antitoxin system VapC family toxin [Desulfocapsa sp.]MBN4058809.1 type II toxin-antitoxin system VapC family toxin [Desulfocapsa sp. AH-315-J15]